MSATVLFVSNGHGEIAIAARIADELPASICADHLALVGDIASPGTRLHDIGPRRALPSGGLIAMGNVRNIVRDVASGLIGHTVKQWHTLRQARSRYDVAIAVGDVFALAMTLRARARKTVYVGTAKSVFVAPYGAFERRTIARADAVFVRDEATAGALREYGIAAESANVIVDLTANAQESPPASFDPLIAVFPGSRDSAYADAVRLCALVRESTKSMPSAGALLSVAPGLDAGRMARELARDGWIIETRDDALIPFVARTRERERIWAWTGAIGAMLAGATLVLGQAGTANEAAAARGVPVVAFETSQKAAWYRRRQIALLGDAMLVVSGNVSRAAHDVEALLADGQRRAAMGETGRARMGPAGGAAIVASEIARLCG